jgi:hypothetical protein
MSKEVSREKWTSSDWTECNNDGHCLHPGRAIWLGPVKYTIASLCRRDVATAAGESLQISSNDDNVHSMG